MTSEEPKTDRTVAYYPLWVRNGPHDRWKRIGRYRSADEANAAADALAATAGPQAVVYVGAERRDAMPPKRQPEE
jgi:hypothetical protein